MKGSMAKLSKSSFVCQSCGGATQRWVGKCPSCGEWNTLVEETDAGPAPGSATIGRTSAATALSKPTRTA